MSLTETIDNFIKELMKKAAIKHQAVVPLAYDEIKANLEEYLLLRLSEDLSQEERDDLFDMIEAFPKSFNLNDYFSEHLPDFEKKIESLLPEFEEVFLKQ